MVCLLLLCCNCVRFCVKEQQHLVCLLIPHCILTLSLPLHQILPQPLSSSFPLLLISGVAQFSLKQKFEYLWKKWKSKKSRLARDKKLLECIQLLNIPQLNITKVLLQRQRATLTRTTAEFEYIQKLNIYLQLWMYLKFPVLPMITGVWKESTKFQTADTEASAVSQS